MRKSLIILYCIILLSLSACGTNPQVCPPVVGTPEYLTLPPDLLPTTTSDGLPIPSTMEIGGRSITVDKVVEGPLCNDTWSGVVYVTCNVQVYPWEEQPTFLKNCNLSIAPDTVVYVAYHNDTPYYTGCSCHTGEITEP
jgi:hypothetical protein